jgi:hypothetical protein
MQYQGQMRQGELWKLIAYCPQAEQVYLVKDRIGGRSSWLTMTPGDDGQWELNVQLEPGQYRFRYYAVEGRTFFNCGSVNLTAVHVRGQDPRVQVEPLQPSALAPSA